MKVLLIEDEPTLLEALKSGLTLSFPTFEIEAVEDAETAERLIAGGFVPRLVVTDVRLPGKNGVDLVRGLQDEHPDIQFILTSAYAPPETLAKVDHTRVLRFLQKPFELAQLVAEVQSAFIKDQFSGSHRRITFVDLLQMLNMAGRTARIEVRDRLSEEALGEIYVVGGEVRHAAMGEVVGEEAFRALCGRTDAVFKMKSDVLPDERTIDESFGFLLMDAFGEADEEATGGEEEGAPDESVREGLDALCREMVEDLPEAAAAVVFDLVSRQDLGSFCGPPFSADRFPAMAGLADHLFRGTEMEAVAEIVPADEALVEVQLKTGGFYHLIARLPGSEAAVWMVLEGTNAPGMGWAVLRMVAPGMTPFVAGRRR